jgi:hypothetical protein
VKSVKIFHQKPIFAYSVKYFFSFQSLVGYIAGFFYEQFGRVGLFLTIYVEMPQFLLAIFYFFYTHSMHVDNLATIVLLFNRLTALLQPIKYNNVFYTYIVNLHKLEYYQKRSAFLIPRVNPFLSLAI